MADLGGLFMKIISITPTIAWEQRFNSNKKETQCNAMQCYVYKLKLLEI